MDLLERGDEYESLNESLVIFICRFEDAQKASTDSEYREQLLREYGLE